MADRKYPDLYVSALDVKPVDYPWDAAKYGEEWDIVRPDVDSWTIEKCRAYLDDQGTSMPRFDIWGEGKDALVAEIIERQSEEEAVEGVDWDDDESVAAYTATLKALGEDDLREMLAEIEEDTVDADEEWRQAAREAMDNDPDAFAPMMCYYYPVPGLSASEAAEAQEKVMDTPCVIVMVDDEPVLALAGGGMDLSPGICQAYINLGYYPPIHFASGLPRLGAGYSWITPEMVEICAEGARIVEEFARSEAAALERFAEAVKAKKESA